MYSIKNTMETFLRALAKGGEGKPFSRFKSWEYCHTEFLKAHNNENKKEIDIDYLALHLSFYLASWGMYRGSSFILQRDYKSHKPIVEVVLNSKYDNLWDFDPLEKTDEELDAIAKLAKDAYEKIEEAYGEIPERYFTDENGDSEKPISTTLITKVLMGTFAISPAFDRFFNDGIKIYNSNHKGEENLGRDTHYYSEKNFSSVLKRLFEFANRHRDELNCADTVTSFPYPIMKKIDMYFWQVGYELGFYNTLNEKKEKLEKNHENCFTNKKSKNSYRKTIEQIKVLIPGLAAKDDDNNHLTTINDYMDVIGKRIKK